LKRFSLGIAGRFHDPRGFQQSASGRYFTFDRRAHERWGIDSDFDGPFRIVKIGGEPGRIIDPTSFATAGFRAGGFCLDQAGHPRITIDNTVLSGAGTVAPTTMFFGPTGRLLITPGLHEYDVG
jgi:hypothetical protein